VFNQWANSSKGEKTLELGTIIEKIQQLPIAAQKVLLPSLEITNFKSTPAGAVLMGMQLLTVLGVPRLIDQVLGEEHTTLDELKQAYRAGTPRIPSCGTIIALVCADMLAYPKRLARIYEIEKLATAWHTGPLLGIEPSLLNDDRIGRSFSKFGEFKNTMKETLHMLTVNTAQRYEISLARFFLDTSLLQLDGLFNQAPKVTAGRGLDSFSQLIVSLGIAAGTRLPVSFEVHPGNTNDGTTLSGMLTDIYRVASPGEIEFMADRAFPTAKNIIYIQSQTERVCRFIAPMKIDKAGQAFRDLVDQAWADQAWKPISYRTQQEKKKNMERTYSAFETVWTVTDKEKPDLESGQTRRSHKSTVVHQETVRCVIYRHGSQAMDEEAARKKKREACEAALEDLSSKLNKRKLQTLKDCQAKGEEILKQYPSVKSFVTLNFSLNTNEAVVFSWAWNEPTFARQTLYDGLFALLTTHPVEGVPANEALVRYRDRNQVEMNFQDLKGILDLERIFLQIPERIETYLFIKVLAYFVLAFLRWYGEAHGLKHEKKLTEANIQDEFSNLAIGKVELQPLGFSKWSVSNDNGLSLWYRTALGLPDPHEDIEILNRHAMDDIDGTFQRWLNQWEQGQMLQSHEPTG